MSVLFRFQRGELEESMKTCVEVADLAALRRILEAENARIGFLGYSVANLEVKPYCFDPRIGWDTHLVTSNGQAIGFTNGPLPVNEKVPDILKRKAVEQGEQLQQAIIEATRDCPINPLVALGLYATEAWRLADELGIALEAVSIHMPTSRIANLSVILASRAKIDFAFTTTS